jgi:5,10-methylenetetrahydromethanopterin reductase
MMDRTSLRIGLDLKDEGHGSVLSAQDFLDCAQAAERLGFDSAWVDENIARDCTALLGAMSQVTNRIELGTAIMNVYSRSALQISMAAASLDDLSDGRLVLGLSVGHHPWNDLGHGIPLKAPVSRLEEYVQFLRKALSGEHFTHDGPVFQGVNTKLAFKPRRTSVSIYIGGERPRMIALAGRVADGLIVNVVGPEYVAIASEQFRAAAKEAGRDPDQLEIMSIVTCCLDDDPAQALQFAREVALTRLRGDLSKRLATLAPQFHDEVRYLKGLIDEGQTERAQEEASPELLRSFLMAGNAETIWDGIERYFAAGCTRVLLASAPRDKEHITRLAEAIAATRKSGVTAAR